MARFEKGVKNFNIMHNVGCAKYVCNYHDGKKTHKDGSPFYDIAIFSNKKVGNKFLKDLLAKGYVPEFGTSF